jgi:hypothetical protein
VTEVPVAVQFWCRLDAMTAQGQELLRTFLQLLETKISGRTRLKLVTAAMNRPIDAVLPHGEVVVRRICQLLGNLTRRKKILAFVLAGAVGLALFLLEISVRRELAKEASDATIDAAPASSASLQKMRFEDLFPMQAASPALLQSADELGVTGTTSSSDYAQTFGQALREPVPFPRPRAPRRRPR